MNAGKVLKSIEDAHGTTSYQVGGEVGRAGPQTTSFYKFKRGEMRQLSYPLIAEWSRGLGASNGEGVAAMATNLLGGIEEEVVTFSLYLIYAISPESDRLRYLAHGLEGSGLTVEDFRDRLPDREAVAPRMGILDPVMQVYAAIARRSYTSRRRPQEAEMARAAAHVRDRLADFFVAGIDLDRERKTFTVRWTERGSVVLEDAGIGSVRGDRYELDRSSLRLFVDGAPQSGPDPR